MSSFVDEISTIQNWAQSLLSKKTHINHDMGIDALKKLQSIAERCHNLSTKPGYAALTKGAIENIERLASKIKAKMYHEEYLEPEKNEIFGKISLISRSIGK